MILDYHGTLHKGPRTDYSTWSRPLGTASGISYGDRFIQIGGWRIADVNGQHFSISHENGNTGVIFKSDGKLFPGPPTPTTSFSTFAGQFARTIGKASGISYGQDFIQIGEWRFGQANAAHLSIAHKDGFTSSIFRHDGILFPGPRTDFGTFTGQFARTVACESPPQGVAVKIISANGLLDQDLAVNSGKSDPFVLVYIKGPWGDEELCRTEYVRNSDDPKWFMTCETEKMVSHVEFQVWDKDFQDADDALGTYTWAADQGGFIAERQQLTLEGVPMPGTILLTIIPTVARKQLVAAR